MDDDRLLVQVADEHKNLRDLIAQLVERRTDVRLAKATPQGFIGARATTRIQPDVLILRVPPYEDVAEHAQKYRDSAPDARIIGFYESVEQKQAMDESGVDVTLELSKGVEALSAEVRKNVAAPAQEIIAEVFDEAKQQAND
ncbi:hypothetical protein [Stratiformator vulcanicus]|uniref:hypothetical protein n=1 Tax=Stratiformator vulcanicus TaxID=2527980 RepID=UPI0011A351C7|nr:hypothetical protein [Stratiformator vulcanicus]